MNKRTNFLKAIRVDLTLELLPITGRLEAAWIRAASNVPLEVAGRALALPLERCSLDRVDVRLAC
jgi:16S rRNA G527 N7-methylase RsmG